MKYIQYALPAGIPKMLPYSTENLAIAQVEAHNGEYTIVELDDEPAAPTTEERLEALEAAMLEMMGVTVDG